MDPLDKQPLNSLESLIAGDQHKLLNKCQTEGILNLENIKMELSQTLERPSVLSGSQIEPGDVLSQDLDKNEAQMYQQHADLRSQGIMSSKKMGRYKSYAGGLAHIDQILNHKTEDDDDKNPFQNHEEDEEESKIQQIPTQANQTQGAPDIMQQLTHIINNCILNAKFEETSVQNELLLQLQDFVQRLHKVSRDIEVIVVAEYCANNFNLSNDGQKPSLEDLSNFAQLLLIDKIRRCCQQEFISIIDQVIRSELDTIQDMFFENPQLRKSIVNEFNRGKSNADLEQAFISKRNEYLSEIRINIDENCCSNDHVIFALVDSIPECLALEVLQTKVMPRLGQIFQQIRHEIVFQKIQYCNEFEATPQPKEPNTYFESLRKMSKKYFPGSNNQEEEKQEFEFNAQSFDDQQKIIKKFQTTVKTLIQGQPVIDPEAQKMILKVIFLSKKNIRRSYDESYMINLGRMFGIDQAEIIRWVQQSDDLNIEMTNLRYKCQFESLIQQLHEIYLRMGNVGAKTEISQNIIQMNRAMNREMFQTFLELWLKNRLKEAIIMQEFEFSLNQHIQSNIAFLVPHPKYLQLFSLENLCRDKKINIRDHLNHISIMQPNDVIAETIEVNKMYGNSGYVGGLAEQRFQQTMTQEILNVEEKSEREYSVIAQRALQILSNVKSKNDDKIPFLQLDKLVGEQKQFENQGTHVTIAVSGWLSEDTNKTEHWEGLLHHYNHGQPEILTNPTMIQCLSWESQTNAKLWKSVLAATGAVAIQAWMRQASGGSITLLEAALLGTEYAGSMITPVKDLFKSAKNQAKYSGQLLAVYLALKRGLIKHQTVSLIGFSLGAQVVKSCIKTLNFIYHGPRGALNQQQQTIRCDLIQNVVILGGATHFKKNQDHWKQIFQNIVNGQFKNVYSKYDRILYLYSISELQVSAGRNPIDLEDDESLVQNYDVSKNVVFYEGLDQKGMGHKNYMDSSVLMELFLNINVK